MFLVELAVAEKRPTSADPLLSSAGEGAKADPLLDGVAAPFEPSASQETDAWAAIQQWHYVAEERRNRRPNVDIYSSANDECISTTSLLTYSVTDAPSTGGRSHRFLLDTCSILFLSSDYVMIH